MNSISRQKLISDRGEEREWPQNGWMCLERKLTHENLQRATIFTPFRGIETPAGVGEKNCQNGEKVVNNGNEILSDFGETDGNTSWKNWSLSRVNVLEVSE